MKVTFHMLAEYRGGVRQIVDEKVKGIFERGLSLKKKGRFLSAVRAFEKCLREELAPAAQIGLLVTTGNCYFAADRLKRAQDLYQKAKRRSEETDDKSGRLSCLVNLGLVSAAGRRWNQAIAEYHEAISLDQNLGHTAGEAIDLNTLALLYENKGDLESAITHYLASLLIFRKLNDEDKAELVENNIKKVRSLTAGADVRDSDQGPGFNQNLT